MQAAALLVSGRSAGTSMPGDPSARMPCPKKAVVTADCDWMKWRDQAIVV